MAFFRFARLGFGGTARGGDGGRGERGWGSGADVSTGKPGGGVWTLSAGGGGEGADDSAGRSGGGVWTLSADVSTAGRWVMASVISDLLQSFTLVVAIVLALIVPFPTGKGERKLNHSAWI